MTNRLGCYSRFGYDLPMSSRLEMIKKTGFSSTSILLSEDEDLVKFGDQDTIPALARGNELFLENVHAPFLDYNKLWFRLKEERAQISEVICSCITYWRAKCNPVPVFDFSKSDIG